VNSVSDNRPLLETIADDRARAESDPLGTGLQALAELDDIHVCVALATWFGDQLDDGAGSGAHLVQVSNLVGFLTEIYLPAELRAVVQRLLRETNGQTQVALAHTLRKTLTWDQRFDAGIDGAYDETLAAARKAIDERLAKLEGETQP
jgi:hypothetical protein